MSRILVFGCGDLAWGRPSSSVLFGRQWNRGRLPERICLGPDGPLPGETPGLDWVSLTAELDRPRCWRPAVPLSPSGRVTISDGEPVSPSLLPGWAELAAFQAGWATRELGGAGVLVTPGEWLGTPRGRQLLEAWAAEGWSWASLERVLESRLSAGVRFVSGSENLLRVTQQAEGFVFAHGVEAACACEISEAVLGRVLERLDRGLAGRWRQEEEPESGWYVHQQLTSRIAKALREGQPRVEVGGAKLVQLSSEGRLTMDQRGTSGALFRFSSAEARVRYQALSTLQISVELPVAAVSWWDEISKPGYLRSAEGVPHPGVRWREGKTILFEGAEIRELSGYLTHRGLPEEELDPARLEEALELGSALPPKRAEEEQRKTPPPVQAPARRDTPAAAEAAARPAVPATPASAETGDALPKSIAPAVASSSPAAALSQPHASDETKDSEASRVTALPGFLPHQFTLEVPHRPDRVQVWLDDGRRIEQENVRRRGAEGLYTIEGVEVAHGAIVRIDFEPSPD